MTDDEAAPSDGAGDRTAELLAAVRAVESGERSAASFFADAGSGTGGAAGGGRGAVPGSGAATAPGGTGVGGGAGGSGGSGSGAGYGPALPGAGYGAVPEGAAEGGGGGPVRPSEELRDVLAAGEAPESLAVPAAEALGEQAGRLLREDPWQLLAVPGVRPEQADGFARALLGGACGPGDERRAQALVGWLLERAALRGHTALEPAELTKGLAQHAVPEPEEALRTAADTGAALLFEDALDAVPLGGDGPGARTSSARPRDDGDGAEGEQPVRLLMGLERYAAAEEGLAEGLARLLSTCAAPEDAETAEDRKDGKHGEDDEDGAVGAEAEPPAEDTAPGTVRTAARRHWEAAAEAAPSPSAAELIRATVDSGLVLHTGGEAARAEPAALVGAARELGLRACAAAHCPGGRSQLARLLHGLQGSGAAGSDAVHQEGAGAAHDAAVTVAGLLAGREGPGRDAEGALRLDLLVVCDAPQLDAEAAAALVESLPDGARLVLSGDPSVLQSAGAGRVFADLLAARACPVLASRTPDPGPIGELVSGIGVGELPEVSAPGREVVIVPVQDAGEAVHRTVQLVADSVPRAIGVPSEHTLVVTPGHGGAAGTRALNSALKERLNPGPGRFAGFDPGDRVAHSPAPGRTTMGTVASGGEHGLVVQCADSGEEFTLPPARVGAELRHGWAVTAHQAAGLRRPAAVVVLPGDAVDALTREWIYTAFGRGERHLSVVQGAGQALPQAVASATSPERSTRLRALFAAAARAARSAPAVEEA